MGKVLTASSTGLMYLYLGLVEVKGLRGYMWLLGRRLYFKTSWRSRDTYYLGHVEDLLGASARLRRLLPRPVDIRTVVAAVAKALAMALYLARRCRGSPKWRYLPFGVEMAIEEAVRLLTARWPSAAKYFKRRGDS